MILEVKKYTFSADSWCGIVKQQAKLPVHGCWFQLRPFQFIQARSSPNLILFRGVESAKQLTTFWWVHGHI
jgi:hypothetical protein